MRRWFPRSGYRRHPRPRRRCRTGTPRRPCTSQMVPRGPVTRAGRSRGRRRRCWPRPRRLLRSPRLPRPRRSRRPSSPPRRRPRPRLLRSSPRRRSPLSQPPLPRWRLRGSPVRRNSPLMVCGSCRASRRASPLRQWSHLCPRRVPHRWRTRLRCSRARRRWIRGRAGHRRCWPPRHPRRRRTPRPHLRPSCRTTIRSASTPVPGGWHGSRRLPKARP